MINKDKGIKSLQKYDLPDKKVGLSYVNIFMLFYLSL